MRLCMGSVRTLPGRRPGVTKTTLSVFRRRKNAGQSICLNQPSTCYLISHMLGHSKEIISADVYGDTAEIIEDCLYAIEPFMEEVLPESREEEYYDYSDLKEIDEAAEEYLMAA